MRIRNPKGPGTYVTLTDRLDRDHRVCFTIDDAGPREVKERLATVTAVIEAPPRKPRRPKSAAN